MAASASEETNFVDVEAGESTYLLGQPDTRPTTVNENIDLSRLHLKENLVNSAAAVTVGTSVASMVMTPSSLVLVSGGIGACIAPYAAMQEKKLAELGMLKDVNERMEEEVETLTEQNKHLLQQVNELEQSVSKLEEMEETLSIIKQTETQSVSALENQLKRSKEILDKMEKNMKSTVLQNIISVVLRSDLDKNMMMDDDEIDFLFEKLEIYDNVEIDELALKKRIIEGGRSLNAVMSLIRDIMNDEDIDDEHKIIRIKE